MKKLSGMLFVFLILSSTLVLAHGNEEGHEECSMHEQMEETYGEKFIDNMHGSMHNNLNEDGFRQMHGEMHNSGFWQRMILWMRW